MIYELFSVYDIVLSAVITGALLSVCAALLGVSLVLKRFSMIGDGLSHVGFGASAVAVAFGLTPLYVSVPVTVAAAFFLLRLGKKSKVKGDALVAVVSSSALAIGYTVTKLSHSGNVDIAGYMFGSIYTITKSDMIITVILTVIMIALYFIFYNKLFSITFDEDFASATGIRVQLYKILLACLTAVTVAIGMRLMGALLMSSLIVFPVLTASNIGKSFKGVVIKSTVSSLICFFGGLLLSFILQVSPGSSVVIVSLAVFLISLIIGKIRK
ncbi:MAG: metal ABC transporter permease [Clostridiales bacterium]|nr:metal ABC transporter permease [Candidatus Equinaster intestinalis]